MNLIETMLLVDYMTFQIKTLHKISRDRPFKVEKRVNIGKKNQIREISS